MDTTLGRRLAACRAQQDMEQGILAAGVGISQTHLSLVEHNRRPLIRMSGESLMRLSKILHVSTDYLLGLTDTPEREQAQSADRLDIPAMARRAYEAYIAEFTPNSSRTWDDLDATFQAQWNTIVRAILDA